MDATGHQHIHLLITKRSNLSASVCALFPFLLWKTHPGPAQMQVCSLHLSFSSPPNFPGGLDSKVSAYNPGEPGAIPGWGRSPGKGNDNPLQYSCLENPMGGGAWWTIVHGVAKSQIQLSDLTLFHFLHLTHLLGTSF